MKRRSGIKIIAVKILITVVVMCVMMQGTTAFTYAAEEMTATGVVNNDKLNVRSGPGTDSDVIAQLKDGDTVDITGIDGDWYRIEYDEEVGYVASKYVEIKGEDADDPGTDDETDEEEDGEEKLEAADANVRPASEIDVTTTAIIGSIMILLVIIIFATVKSIRNLSDDDEYYEEDDYPYEEDDDYSEDEEDYAEDDDYTGDEDDYPEEYFDQEEDDIYENEHKEIPPALKAVRDGADPARYMSDNPEDYRIDIDPKYFEKTATLPDLNGVLDEDDPDAPIPLGPSDDPDAPAPLETPDERKMTQADKDAQLAAAYKKMEELREELERIKNEQT